MHGVNVGIILINSFCSTQSLKTKKYLKWISRKDSESGGWRGRRSANRFGRMRRWKNEKRSERGF